MTAIPQISRIKPARKIAAAVAAAAAATTLASSLAAPSPAHAAWLDQPSCSSMPLYIHKTTWFGLGSTYTLKRQGFSDWKWSLAAGNYRYVYYSGQGQSDVRVCD